jgi:hypothetical protein
VEEFGGSSLSVIASFDMRRKKACLGAVIQHTLCDYEMTRFRKTILSVLFGLFAACLIFSFVIYVYFDSTLPSVPDQQAGLTFKMDIGHGFIRYGSERQLRVLEADKNTVFPLSFIPFLLAGALGLKWIGVRR